MQLPNVVTGEDKEKLDAIVAEFDIPSGYDCAGNSFLQSVCTLLPDAPQTLLREHYRCHPRIIDFCNRKFYGGGLLIMTEDDGNLIHCAQSRQCRDIMRVNTTISEKLM